MNTCLSSLYLKLSKIDTRYVALALMVFAIVASGGIVMGVPIHGDVGI